MTDTLSNEIDAPVNGHAEGRCTDGAMSTPLVLAYEPAWLVSWLHYCALFFGLRSVLSHPLWQDAADRGVEEGCPPSERWNVGWNLFFF